MNINALMKQAQKMQKEMAAKEKELHEKTYEASVNNNAVRVIANGAMKIEKIEIEESLLVKENKEIMEDLVMMAVNEVVEKIEKEKEETLQDLTGGIKVPGMF